MINPQDISLALVFFLLTISTLENMQSLTAEDSAAIYFSFIS